jgi:hypothetical protein
MATTMTTTAAPRPQKSAPSVCGPGTAGCVDGCVTVGAPGVPPGMTTNPEPGGAVTGEAGEVVAEVDELIG